MLDFIAIGLGPFNLSLASLLHNKTDLDYLFFEKKAQFDWHTGMQLPNTVLQVPFIADLVSMVDPTSPFSFLQYLNSKQRLYKFYFLQQLYIPRCEYNCYCQWVANQLLHINYQSHVLSVKSLKLGFEVTVEQDGKLNYYHCRNLVIGSGNQPYLPKCLNEIQKYYPEKCRHSSDYLHYKIQNLKGNVVVIGSGQSAAEVFLDLFNRQYLCDQTTVAQFQLHWLTRAIGFLSMESGALGLEHFTPDYIQYFYQLNISQKYLQVQKQSLLYQGISSNTLCDIYNKLYHRSIAENRLQTYLHSHSNLIDAQIINQKIRLVFQHQLTKQVFYLDAETIIATTGYCMAEFKFMQDLTPLIHTDIQGHWKISKDYRLQHDALGEIYVQNQETHTHGVGAPDLGLGAYRAAIIINQLTGDTVYDIPETIQSFQSFDITKNPEISLLRSNEYIK